MIVLIWSTNICSLILINHVAKHAGVYRMKWCLERNPAQPETKELSFIETTALLLISDMKLKYI